MAMAMLSSIHRPLPTTTPSSHLQTQDLSWFVKEQAVDFRFACNYETITLHSRGSITAGHFSTFLGHPLDTIEVHQQTNPHISRELVKYSSKRR
mmetsp:Transcript_38058/g.62201  ORF Transcript_38058/g.62201 Transcript_38058/m.62201 type:complete len:94 (+) Transcript_38058:129-410(+)